MITDQVKDYCYGLYGKPPRPIDRDLQQKALKGYPRGETPITTRPADILEPGLPEVQAKTEGLAQNLEEQLIVALYPVTGKRFLEGKHGKAEPPEVVGPVSLEEGKRRRELVEKAKLGQASIDETTEGTEKGPELRTFDVYIDGQYHKLEISQVGGPPLIAAATAPSAEASGPPPTPSAPAPEDVEGTPIVAPMPGMVIRYAVKVGDEVQAHDTIVILEAMKMENAIASDVAGTVKEIFFREGDPVKKGQILAVVE
jgi:biotin carboxyl carrier protein